MISEDVVAKVIEKHNLKPLKNPSSARESIHQVVHMLKEMGMSNVQIGRELGLAESSVRSLLKTNVPAMPLPQGTHVEFDPFDGDTGFPLHGVVQNYLPPDGKRFKGGYHIACYYVVPPEEVREANDRKILAREAIPVEEAVIQTDMNLPEISTELVEAVRAKTGLLPSTIINLLSLGWRYVEKDREISRWEHPMWRLEGQVTPASYDSMYEVLSKPIND